MAKRCYEELQRVCSYALKEEIMNEGTDDRRSDLKTTILSRRSGGEAGC